jgi:hypothetical protein
MNIRLSRGVVACAALTALLAGRPSAQPAKTADDGPRFVGAWRLVSLEEPGADGKVHAVDATGMLAFTRDGHVSVQVMYREAHGGAAGPVQYAQGGYEASFGRYGVDAAAHTFTFDVEGALVRSLVGQHLVRAYELSSTRLIVRSANPDESWRVVWERR